MWLAIYNFGMFRDRAESPGNQGFRDREPVNLDAVERAPGFIGRAGYEGESKPESWGVQVYPRFYVDRGDGWAPSTLSLWADIESLMAFTFRSPFDAHGHPTVIDKEVVRRLADAHAA
jgi:Domain of unknown function (DUF3291)